jgi:hypothetical protein
MGLKLAVDPHGPTSYPVVPFLRGWDSYPNSLLFCAVLYCTVQCNTVLDVFGAYAGQLLFWRPAHTGHSRAPGPRELHGRPCQQGHQPAQLLMLKTVRSIMVVHCSFPLSCTHRALPRTRLQRISWQAMSARPATCTLSVCCSLRS